MKQPIYLDYASTTPVDPVVADKMTRCLTLDGTFANPASRSHRYGWQAEELVDIGRNQVADLVNADPREIVFTSGATESNNLAIKGAVEALQGQHVITVVTEHKAVLDPCEVLQQKGVEVTYLTPDSDGLIEPEQVRQALREETALVSVMHVNNEIGVIQDIAAIGEVCRDAGVLLHVDAAQSAGKLPIDLQALNVDLMSFSAHKNYGPKGIGALYVRRSPDVTVLAQIHGGGHERKMRSGTLPTHQIVGMGEAFARSQALMTEESQRIARLRDKLWEGIQDLDGLKVNGTMTQRVAGNLNVSFAGVDGEALIMSLRDIAVSTGSACTSASVEPSYVLKAIGVTDELAHSSIRFSVGRFTTDEDIDHAISHIRQIVKQVRQMSQLW